MAPVWRWLPGTTWVVRLWLEGAVFRSFTPTTLALTQAFPPAPQSWGYQDKLTNTFVLRVSASKAISNKGCLVLWGWGCVPLRNLHR